MEPLGGPADPLEALRRSLQPLDPLEELRRRLAGPRRAEELRAQAEAHALPEEESATLGDLAKAAPGRFFRAPIQSGIGHLQRLAAVGPERGGPSAAFRGFARERGEEGVRAGAEELRQFEELGQSYLSGAESVPGAVGRALAKSGVEIAGYGAQGLATAPVEAVTIARLGATMATPLARALVTGAMNSAWEALEGGRPEVAFGVGAALGALTGNRAATAAAERLKAAARAKAAAEAPASPVAPLAREPAPIPAESGPAISRPLRQPAATGRESEVFSGQDRARVRFAVLDIDDAVPSHDARLDPNPAYRIPALQNRLRGAQSRKATELQVTDITARLTPERLGESAEAAAGSPIVLPDGNVVTGNGRWIALRRLYDQPEHRHHGTYRQWLTENAEEFGISPEAVQALERPLLVRVLEEPMDEARLVRFAEEANAPVAAELKPTEQALSDARRVSATTLEEFVPNDDGSVVTASNRDFVRSFAREAVRPEEQGTFFGEHGELSIQGRQRVEAALFARAYKDPALIQTIFESEEQNIRLVGRALKAQAVPMARLEALVESGDRYPLSIADDIYQAAAKLQELRDQKLSVPDYLAQRRMEPEVSPEAERILAIFDENARAPKRLADVLQRYTELADEQGNPRQAGLLEAPVASKMELLERAAAEASQANAELKFAGGPTADPTLGLLAGGPEPLFGPLSRMAGVVKATSWVKRWLTNYGRQAGLGRSAAQGRRLEHLMASGTDPADLAPYVAERERMTGARLRAHGERKHMIDMDFDAALKRQMRGDKAAGIERTEDEVLLYVLDGLEGRNDLSSVQPELRHAALAYREFMDELSGRALDELPLSQGLRLAIAENRGTYVHRLFAFHRSPDEWRQFVKVDEPWRWETMRAWMQEQYPNRSVDWIEGKMEEMLSVAPDAFEALTPRAGDRKHFGIFTKRLDSWHVVSKDVNTGQQLDRSFTSKENAERFAEKLRQQGVDAEINRQGLPQEIDDFLGLSLDPRVRMGASIMKLAHHLETNQFLEEVAEAGLGRVFFTRPRKGAGTRIAGGDARSPLSELYASPEVAKIVSHLTEAPQKAESWVRWLYDSNSLVRVGKTAYSQQTHIRNLQSWVPHLFSQGKFLSPTGILRAPGRLIQATKGAVAGHVSAENQLVKTLNAIADRIETVGGKRLSSVFRFDLDELRQWRLAATRYGVTEEGARSAEAEYDAGRIIERARELGKVDWDSNPAMRWVRKAGRVPRIFYIEEDNIGKLFAWQAEVADYAAALDMDVTNPRHLAELQEMTAPLVRDLYWTYSKAPPAVQFIRKVPFIADFPTFWEEVHRTSKNTWLQGLKELRSENPKVKAIGARRLAGWISQVFVNPRVIKAYFRGQTGSDENDERTIGAAGPPWSKHGDWAIIEKKAPGKYRAVDTSFSNPHTVYREPLRALFADNNLEWTDRVEEAAKAALDPFMSESILFGTAASLYANRDPRSGAEIYPETGDWLQVRAMGAFFGWQIAPGQVRSLRRLILAAEGRPDPRNRQEYDFHEELIALGVPTPRAIREGYAWMPGARIVDIDVPRSLYYDGWDLSKIRRSLVRSWNTSKAPGVLTPKDRLVERDRLQASWDDSVEDLYRQIEVYRDAGVPEHQLRKALKESQVFSESDLDLFLAGARIRIFQP